MTSPVLGMKTVRLAPSPWERAAQPEVAAKLRRAEGNLFTMASRAVRGSYKDVLVRAPTTLP